MGNLCDLDFNIVDGKKQRFRSHPCVRACAVYLPGFGIDRKSALSRAIREAIAYCLDHDILAEYLKRRSGEVLNMFTMEFDINVAEQVWKEEALEKGREMGRREGEDRGRQAGRSEILELMNRVESMEDFMRLRERLNTSGSTRSVQS